MVEQANELILDILPLSAQTARLVRVYGTAPCVALPGTLPAPAGGSFALTELGDYCFSEKPRSLPAADALCRYAVSADGTVRLTRAFGQAVGQKPARRYDFDLDAPAADEEELHPVCGSFLEEVTLPDSVQVIGSCAFYNCRSLRLLTVGSGGLTVGSDVFLNCFALETLRVQAAPEQPTGLFALVNNITEAVQAQFWPADAPAPLAALWYPAYWEDIEETPAHILLHTFSGQGYHYRQCFLDNKFLPAEYDAIFPQGHDADDAAVMAMLCFGRLRYPWQLTEAAAGHYRAFLAANTDRVFARLLKAQDTDSIRALLALDVLDKAAFASAAALAAKAENAAAAALLADAEHKKYAPQSKKQRYDFDFLRGDHTLPKEKFFDPRKPFQSQRPETHEEWQARMGGEVLAVVRSGLYLDFRFLDMALSALNPAPDERCRVLATDGQTLYYQPQRLLQLYQENPKYLNRLYLHTIFHCVFRHLWLKGRREPQLWSLACDIAVENVIDSLQRKSVMRPLTYVRQNAYRQITAEEKVVAAAPVYRWLTRQTPGVLRQLEREFVTDDHRLWPKDAPEQPQQMPTPLPQKTWQKIGERMQTELDLRDKEAGEGTDALKQQVKAANRSRRSYKDFLRRFCVLREEVKLDPDEFDLNFYTYGLSVYGNLPLIEPLESRESKKIEELALVIDTSYSTSGELVRAFLAETYTLLKGRENFFHRMNLHLIQADNAVRQDILIRNEDELIHAMNHFELRGGGGTDFRPAFAYVDQLCAEKKFSNLRGLLYFTDGMGTYPARRPGYDTAFLFLGERFDDANVPPWAMKVVLDEEEFTGAAARPASALADALAEEDDLYRELNNS